jgi:hypothetical protein
MSQAVEEVLEDRWPPALGRVRASVPGATVLYIPARNRLRAIGTLERFFRPLPATGDYDRPVDAIDASDARRSRVPVRCRPHPGDLGLGDQWTDFPLEIEEIVDGDSAVLGRGRASGTLNGSATGYGFVHAFTIRDGKIARFDEYVAPPEGGFPTT